ncbi:hypothetical protein [Rosistilla ulvae]|uniref:hypothetical protein n=1 Tax=Rosistilla ulvae TaxID=1930277 RepID=UPI001C54CEB0|nr:hypothetical protein [Rosistilla ulvae]
MMTDRRISCQPGVATRPGPFPREHGQLETTDLQDSTLMEGELPGEVIWFLWSLEVSGIGLAWIRADLRSVIETTDLR